MYVYIYIYTYIYIYIYIYIAQANIMLLRATRAARVGARAGRLTRLLRILRFLPFLNSAKNDARVGIASSISSQLANLLATRVAALTILMVMCIPMFDLWTFPSYDYSPQTWVQRLSTNAEESRMEQTLKELGLMAEFYSRYDYGPYMACIGAPVTVDGVRDFRCDPGYDYYIYIYISICVLVCVYVHTHIYIYTHTN